MSLTHYTLPAYFQIAEIHKPKWRIKYSWVITVQYVRVREKKSNLCVTGRHTERVRDWQTERERNSAQREKANQCSTNNIVNTNNIYLYLFTLTIHTTILQIAQTLYISDNITLKLSFRNLCKCNVSCLFFCWWYFVSSHFCMFTCFGNINTFLMPIKPLWIELKKRERDAGQNEYHRLWWC